MNHEPLFFKPICKERVWGGCKIGELLERSLPAEKLIGESWEVVDRPEACSVIELGPFTGWTLRGLIQSDPESIMGPGWPADKPFPVLIKWLDCRERLSLQVHPPASIAPQLRGEPKTECWYIAECEPDAGIIAGLNAPMSKEAFENALRANELEALCHRFAVSKGDSLFIPSGRIHAIDAGNFILEIQQNSDTTYRVYDWGRVGLDGTPRELHIEESLQSINFDDVQPSPQRSATGTQTIADCDCFRVRKHELAPAETFTHQSGEEPRLLTLVEGEAFLQYSDSTESAQKLVKGTNLLFPYASKAMVQARTPVTYLLTDHFNRH